MYPPKYNDTKFMNSRRLGYEKQNEIMGFFYVPVFNNCMTGCECCKFICSHKNRDFCLVHNTELALDTVNCNEREFDKI